MYPETLSKPQTKPHGNRAGGSWIGIYVANALIALFLSFFCLGLASQSPAAYMQAPPASFVLGKSPRLWILVMLSATLCLLAVFVRVRRADFLRSVGKVSRRVLLALVITVVLYEAAGFTFARYLPIKLLENVPDWVKDALPSSAFERADFFDPNTWIASQELGGRLVANLNFLQARPGVSAVRVVTDSNGFPNMDESFYRRADIITFGDSFTTAGNVDFQDSWPQQLGTLTGARILNLAQGGSYPFHFWRLAERFGIEATPQILVVGLNSRASTSTFYEYVDYVKLHPEIQGMHEYLRVTQRNQSYQVWQYPDPLYPNWLSVASRNMLVPISWVVPFTSATLEFMVDKLFERTIELCTFSLAGKSLMMPGNYFPQTFPGQDFPEPMIDLRIKTEFEALVQLSSKHNIRLFLVYLPVAQEIYYPLLQQASNLSECAKSLKSEAIATNYHVGIGYRHLLNLASASGTQIYDSTPYLQANALAGEQLNLDFDDHPSSLGHLRIAEFVQSILTEEGAKEALDNNRKP